MVSIMIHKDYKDYEDYSTDTFLHYWQVNGKKLKSMLLQKTKMQKETWFHKSKKARSINYFPGMRNALNE